MQEIYKSSPPFRLPYNPSMFLFKSFGSKKQPQRGSQPVTPQHQTTQPPIFQPFIDPEYCFEKAPEPDEDDVIPQARDGITIISKIPTKEEFG